MSWGGCPTPLSGKLGQPCPTNQPASKQSPLVGRLFNSGSNPGERLVSPGVDALWLIRYSWAATLYKLLGPGLIWAASKPDSLAPTPT
ncbi:hypothetical protein DSO57_1026802 [Entomophthora muscae]|uniref:Uncharacterized protein n=1 Tax=Entomophthora muscae TaxID=34485 RepID=A0ACC2TD50_9FUNG|nr:hypothetical protein DSO57_1026802 [Entomophthora muscae]